jgi:hypothetical protein
MPLKFRANDGQEYPVLDRAVLHELLVKGVIARSTLLYEEEKDAWTEASEHPDTKEWFAAHPAGAAPVVHESPPPREGLSGRPRKSRIRAWVFGSAALTLAAVAIAALLAIPWRRGPSPDGTRAPGGPKRHLTQPGPAQGESESPAQAAESPEQIAVAQVEGLARVQLEREAAVAVQALNAAGLYQDIGRPENLASSWGIQEFRRKLADSKTAVYAFRKALESVRQDMIKAIETKDIAPTFKGDYVAGLSQGSAGPEALSKCRELAASLGAFLAAAEDLLNFMATASCTVEGGNMHFAYPADKERYAATLGSAKSAFDRCSQECTGLQAGLKNLPTLATPEPGAHERTPTGTGVALPLPLDSLEASKSEIKSPSDRILRAGQEVTLDCKDRDELQLVLTDRFDGKGEAIVTTPLGIEKYLSARGANNENIVTLNGVPVPSRGTFGVVSGRYVIELTGEMHEYFSDVAFDDAGIFGPRTTTQYRRVPCQSGSIVVHCLTGEVGVRAVE